MDDEPARPLPRLSRELIERILVFAIKSDLRGTSVDAYTRVAPGLLVARKLLRRKIEWMPFDRALSEHRLLLLHEYKAYCKPCDLQYDAASLIPEAIFFNRLHVLKWWLRVKQLRPDPAIKIKITKRMQYIALAHSNTDVFDWFVDAGLSIKALIVEWALLASGYEDMKVYRWCMDHGAPLDLLYASLETACEVGDVSKLKDWWKNRSEQLITMNWDNLIRIAVKSNNTRTLDCLTEFFPVDVAIWAQNEDGTPKYLMDAASKSNAFRSLEWIRKNLTRESRGYTEAALEDYDDDDQKDMVLERLTWWRESGHLLRYTAVALAMVTARRWSKVVKWWFNSGLELEGLEP
ncbi:hypothetical protein H9P43_002580 [Blastocladiella emersonii ATCC 22665]|nr:hypothetical protein H9P43_002580 [Blastocladiella emersonii ATCC 22665]